MPTRPAEGWPLLMDQATACRFTSTKRSTFGALVKACLFPPPREIAPGEKLWHQDELRDAAARLWQLERGHSLEQARDGARRALEAFQPVPARRSGQGRR